MRMKRKISSINLNVFTLQGVSINYKSQLYIFVNYIVIKMLQFELKGNFVKKVFIYIILVLCISMNFASTPTAGSVAVKVAGVETIWVPANSMYPETTNGCALITQVELGNGPEMKVLDFDPSSDEHAQFSVAFPKSWNEGTITFKAYFTVTGTNTGTVAWGLSGVAIADDDSINTAFGTNVVATAKAHSGTSNDLNVTAESGAVTIAGSPAAGEQVFFQIMRDVSADDQSGDARLLGVQLFFTTDAANDA